MQSDLHAPPFAEPCRGDAQPSYYGGPGTQTAGAKGASFAAFGRWRPPPSSNVREPQDSSEATVKTRNEISAGGVIYRPGDHGPDVCLIATQGGKAWQLPKGLIERGEQPEEAARRELAEETGLQGELLQRLDRIEYRYVWDEDGERVRIHKLVDFFFFL